MLSHHISLINGCVPLSAEVSHAYTYFPRHALLWMRLLTLEKPCLFQATDFVEVIHSLLLDLAMN